MGEDRAFRVLVVGFDFWLIEHVCDRVQAETGFAFSHILEPALDKHAVSKRPDSARLFCIRDDVRMSMPRPDARKLAMLEQPGVPTIHTMIMSDRIVRNLDYSDGLAYATYLADRFEYLYERIKPSIIVGGFDGLHTSMAFAVARKLGIPWFSNTFGVIVPGLTGYCAGMTPGTLVPLGIMSPEELRAMSEQGLLAFETGRTVIPAYLSANNLAIIARRLPKHFATLYETISRVVAGRFDRFTEYPLHFLVREYFRKRTNLLLLPKHWFVDKPPREPYLFFGFHMQPESSIDVWAPFYADQFNVVEAIARAAPPSHQILIKLHKSDADNYSRHHLDRLRRLPGVRLVSPFVSSRVFIENAALALTIHGHIGLEAALLGRPVLVFGDSRMTELPSVTRVGRVTDLPAQIRSKLSEAPPTREAIIQGFMKFLSNYAPGCSSDWNRIPPASEIEALAKQFRALRKLVENQNS